MAKYSDAKWSGFREKILQRDGYKCTQCGITVDDAVLQVHHEKYLYGKKPWEVPEYYCVTLCKGCHAEEHGIIPPKTGWEYMGEDDLGDLIGECEYCGSELRYEHYLFHPKWGELTVGSGCADNLLDNDRASRWAKSRKVYIGKLRRFMDSPRWRETSSGNWRINQKGTFILCYQSGDYWKVRVDETWGNKKFKSLDEAKKAAFEGYCYLHPEG